MDCEISVLLCRFTFECRNLLLLQVFFLARCVRIVSPLIAVNKSLGTHPAKTCLSQPALIMLD
jgi:hypothetical protein